jgi:predicted RNA binding protein YcfA (HicA-like mRNA interferase family)
MLRRPGNVTRDDLEAALNERGWTFLRERKHRTWAKGPRRIAIPKTLKGTGTIRGILKEALDAEGDDDERRD